MRVAVLTVLLLAARGAWCAAPAPLPLADRVACAVPDRQAIQLPDCVQLDGWLGVRVRGNEANRLVSIDTDRLLEGYRRRPGRQTWDGEHVGKWLHAATLAWANTGDAALRTKLDLTVAELCKCQLPDGYLGTYLDKDRWTHWDVWAHKYNLIGLITYMRYTGNQSPMATCRRMADLICETFGDKPGQRDIIKAGHHVGMAPTSILEPMVLLYRLTGEPRYLEFCRYLLRSWEQPDGPKIVSKLLAERRVDRVGNAKAYEMLSCLNGVLEYYRTVGDDRRILQACLFAWQDIVENRLYLTGAASAFEHFRDNHDLPNVANVGETCVTVTWLQLNAQLLRITGEAWFAEQIERVTLNQLMGAQRPDCAAWGYYVQMEGRKPYSQTLDGHCCLSSGPRGFALLPTLAVTTDRDGVVVNLYDAGHAKVKLADGKVVELRTQTKYPLADTIEIGVALAAPASFAIKLRVPGWAPGASLKINGEPAPLIRGGDGYAAITRNWKAGDTLALTLPLEVRIIVGDHTNQGKVALMYGPLVLAADEALLPADAGSLSRLVVPSANVVAAHRPPPGDATGPCFTVRGQTRRGAPFDLGLLAFAEAGGSGSRYRVWLPVAGQASDNLLLDGVESRSRTGNRANSIIDDDVQNCVVTFDGQAGAEDWYAVTLETPLPIGRIVFLHGQVFHDGGWFDASQGKPEVQVRRAAGGAWETVGRLDGYPATTARDNGKLRPGQAFELRLAKPMEAVAVRVLGRPASGDNPKQAFSSCAELQAFRN